MPAFGIPVASLPAVWIDRIPEQQWSLYCQVLDLAIDRKIDFALGGSFAMARYTGTWRDTKDLDLYVLPQDRDAMIQVLADCGFEDYFDTKPYDRWWIYRSCRDGEIVDVIWAMANHRAQIDDLWLSGPRTEIRGYDLKVLPAEAIFWDKLYIMQRDRCDWPDALNLLNSVGEDINWAYLFCRIGEDSPLAAGVLSVFRWIAPGRAQALPAWIWERLSIDAPPAVQLPEVEPCRVSLLDTRPWFGPDRERFPC